MHIKKILPALVPTSGIVVPWYLSGAVPLSNCKAAYAAKGVASLAAGLVNLVKPGTNDLTVAVDLDVPLAWDATNGFKLVYDSLATGLNLSGTNKQWSAIIRYSNASAVGWLFGIQNQFGISQNSAGSNTAYSSGSVGISYAATGVAAIAGNKYYLNGVEAATIGAGGNITATNFALGGNYDGSAFNARITLYIQAFAAYDTPLTVTQVAAISAAMAAL